MQLYVKVTNPNKSIRQKDSRRSETRPTLQLEQLSNEQQTVSFLPPSIHPVFSFLPHPQRSKYTCQLQTTAGSPVIKQPALPVRRAHNTHFTFHTWLRRAGVNSIIAVAHRHKVIVRTPRPSCRDVPIRETNGTLIRLRSWIAAFIQHKHTLNSHPDHGTLMKNQTRASDGSHLSSLKQLTGFIADREDLFNSHRGISPDKKHLKVLQRSDYGKNEFFLIFRNGRVWYFVKIQELSQLKTTLPVQLQDLLKKYYYYYHYYYCCFYYCCCCYIKY